MQNGAFDPFVAPTPTFLNKLYSWGRNNNGQLGLGNTTNYSSPKQVGALTDWLKVSGGFQWFFAIKQNGTLWAWGDNNRGQLGQGNTTNYSSPKQIGALTNWKTLSTNRRYAALAIKTDNTLWAWGQNDEGQLGLGNKVDRYSPVQVGTLSNWSVVSTGVGHAVVVKTDGTLWAWGLNDGGQLGLNNTTNYSSPKQVGALTDWYKVSCGNHSSLAIKTNGTLWSWGNGTGGILGSNSTSNRSSPAQVGALTDWVNVSCGDAFALAVKTNGTLWSWGAGNDGQLGLGNTTSYSSPKQVGILTNWSGSPSGSTYHSGALKTDGTLWMWGYNDLGQLGLGNTTSYSSPKQVGTLTNWNIVYIGANSSIANFSESITPYIQYGGSWSLNDQINAKAAGTWP
jgi:alpha-tubulin suppressor-like RCC1 family protein